MLVLILLIAIIAWTPGGFAVGAEKPIEDEEKAAFYKQVLKDDPGNVEANVYLADKAYQAGKFNDSIGYYQTALATEPNNTELIIKVGKAYALANQPDQAEAMYKRALSIDPKCVDAHYGLGLLCEVKGQFKEAAEHFAVVFAAQPDNADIKNRLAYTWLNLGRYEEAANLFEKIAESNPSDPVPVKTLVQVYLELNNGLKAEATLKRYAADNPGDLYATELLAQFYEERGRLDEALEAFKEFVRQNPGSRDGENAIGNFYHRHRQFDKAAEVYAQMTKTDPKDERAWTNLVNTYRDSGQIEKALQEADNWIANDPNTAAPYRLKAAIYREQRKFKEALRAHEKSKGAEQGSVDPYLAIAEIYWKDLGQLDYAIQELKDAARFFPSDLIVKKTMAEIYEEQKNYTAAIDILRNMELLDPQNVQIGLNISRLLLLAGKPQDAIVECQKLLDKDKENLGIYVRLADAYEQLGQIDKAIKVYEDSPQKSLETQAWAKSRISALKAKEGKLDEAIAGYKWVLEHFPDADKHYAEIVNLEKQRGSVGEAVKYLSDSLVGGVERKAAVQALVTAYELQGLKPSEIVEKVRKIQSRCPKNKAVAEMLVDYCDQNKLKEPLIQSLEGLLKIDPEAVEQRRRLAKLYAESGKHTNAIAHLRKVVGKSEYDAENYYLLGQLLEKTGKLDEAKEAYRIACGFENLEAQKALERLEAEKEHLNKKIRQ
ncbi:MAG: tetratricopeptide repeat protein [Armatimonadota bacterium]|nr:tetratricopeptide repeat protein [Armatimonadota bacterium]